MSKHKYITEEYLEENILSDYSHLIYGGIFIILQLVFGILATYLYTKMTARRDNDLTYELRDVTGDDSVNVYYIADGDPNAFNAGTSSLYYTTGIKKLLNNNELVAVLLHEYGHHKHSHLQKDMFFNSLTNIALIGFLWELKLPWIAKIIAYIFGNDIPDILYSVTFGRKFEYDADETAAEYGYGRELISSFRKMQGWMRNELCQGMSRGECDRLIEELHSLDEHPSMKNRIENIMKNFVRMSKFADITKIFKLKKIFLGILKKYSTTT